MSQFLHIVPDEKFIDIAISFFAGLGGNHRYLCICNKGESPFIYIKSKEVERLLENEVRTIITKGNYEAIVFHTLYPRCYPLVLCVPDKKTVFWFSWGADIYYGINGFHPVLNLNLYRPITRRFLDRDISMIKRVKRKIKRILPARKGQYARNLLQARAISKVDLCSTIIPTEYESLLKLPFFSAKFFPFKYVSDKNKEVSRFSSEGLFVLVNNSADLSGNHLDVLNLMNKRKITNPRIIPVSYGRNKAELLSILPNYIRKNIDTLITDFMSIDDYKNRVHFCRAAVFGHIRQQALGNIVLCLRAGMKVFLYKKSLVYRYFKRIGIVLFSIEDDLSQNSINQPLTEMMIQKNLGILSELYDYKTIMSYVAQSLEENGLRVE